MANIITGDMRDKVTEGVAIVGNQLRRAGDELVSGQAAEAARKLLAELGVSRPKAWGGTYGFYAIQDDAKAVDGGWQASMAALREGWEEILEGTNLLGLLPAGAITAGRTEMRGRYFTGCWEVTADEPLTNEQREALVGALETAGYALVCPAVEAADMCWRLAVPASFAEKGPMLQAMHTAGVVSIGMMDRAHDYQAMPSDMRYAAGADAKARPPDQVAWVFDMTVAQAVEVKLQGQQVFKDLGRGGLEVVAPADLLGSLLVPNDTESGKLTFLVRGISDSADVKQDGAARLAVASWLGIPQSSLDMRPQNGTVQESFRCDAVLGAGPGSRDMKAMVKAAQVLGDCGQSTTVGDYALWVHAGKYRLELAAQMHDGRAYEYFLREEAVRAEKRSQDTVAGVKSQLADQLALAQAADVEWKERVETVVVTQAEETRRLRDELGAKASELEAARLGSLKELQERINADKAEAATQAATAAAALKAALKAEKGRSQRQLAALVEMARQDRHAAASQGVLTVASLLQLMRPAGNGQEQAVPACLAALEVMAPQLVICQQGSQASAAGEAAAEEEAEEPAAEAGAALGCFVGRRRDGSGAAGRQEAGGSGPARGRSGAGWARRDGPDYPGRI